MEPRAEIRGEMEGCFDLTTAIAPALLVGAFVAGVVAVGLLAAAVLTAVFGILLTIALGVGVVVYAVRRETYVSDAAGQEDTADEDPVDQHAATAVTEDRSVSGMVQDAIAKDVPTDAEVECLRRNTLDLDAAGQLELAVQFAAATALFHGPVPYIPAQPDIAEEA